ncbi:MAG: glycosyltransferase [Pseudomonadota bacterium]
MPSVLFVHNGVPGRFRWIAEALQQKGWSCALINGDPGNDLPSALCLKWQASRIATPDTFHLAARAETDIIRGRAALECAFRLRDGGFKPDVIIGHPAWGEMLFLREAFPEARQIQIGEFYSGVAPGADFHFDSELRRTNLDTRLRYHAKNATLSLSLLSADRIVAPTPFQASVFPPHFASRTSIIHEGVDTNVARKRAGAKFQLREDLIFDGGAPLITFINRHFEPLRGFHIFMRALPQFLGDNPEAHVVLIGEDAPRGYGPKAPNGSWKGLLLKELQGKLDLARVHFPGRLDYDQLIDALSVSWAHVYLTYPFVLSWSLLDAMACEALIVGSDTAPVRDVIRHGENGLLTDFFDTQALVETLTNICRAPRQYDGLRRAARETVVTRYDRDSVCLPAWMQLINDMLAG